MVQERLSERQKAADAIPRHLALYYQIAPLKLDHDTLTIAIAEIEHPNLMQALSEVTGYQIDPLIYPEAKFALFWIAATGCPQSEALNSSLSTTTYLPWSMPIGKSARCLRLS